MTDTARGWRRAAPSPKPRAIGNRPKLVVSVVIKMGRRRKLPASSSASRM